MELSLQKKLKVFVTFFESGEWFVGTLETVEVIKRFITADLSCIVSFFHRLIVRCLTLLVLNIRCHYRQ